MLLELSATEARELKEALESTLRRLLEEIAHADQRAYRDMLRERHARMEQLSRRLEGFTEEDSVYA